MYEKERKSTPMISDELHIEKRALLITMHHYRIKMRNTSEATKNQMARDGVWNKGKTKETHPSIEKYAANQRGDKHYFHTRPGAIERHLKILAKIKRSPKCTGSRNPKTTEVRMVKILDEHNFHRLRNFFIAYKKTWRTYDFLVEGSLIVEMQGDYYHANPRKYKPDDTIVVAHKRRKAKEIWEYDKEKKALATEHGYKFIAIWEDKFLQMTDEEAVNIIKGALND